MIHTHCIYIYINSAWIQFISSRLQVPQQGLAPRSSDAPAKRVLRQRGWAAR